MSWGWEGLANFCERNKTKEGEGKQIIFQTLLSDCWFWFWRVRVEREVDVSFFDSLQSHYTAPLPDAESAPRTVFEIPSMFSLQNFKFYWGPNSVGEERNGAFAIRLVFNETWKRLRHSKSFLFSVKGDTRLRRRIRDVQIPPGGASTLTRSLKVDRQAERVCRTLKANTHYCRNTIDPQIQKGYQWSRRDFVTGKVPRKKWYVQYAERSLYVKQRTCLHSIFWQNQRNEIARLSRRLNVYD